MILCFCRAANGKDGEKPPLNEKIVQIYIQKNPDLLAQDWKAVSFAVAGCSMKCGSCEEAGNQFLGQLRMENEVAALTASPA